MDPELDLIITIQTLLREGKTAEAQRLISDALERGIDLPHGPYLQEIEDAAMARALGVDRDA
jgi:hypothetical protein